MPHAKNPNQLQPVIVAIKRQVPGGAVRDDKLPPMHIHPSSNVRMRCEYRNGRPDLGQRGTCGFRRGCKKKLDDPVEIFERLVRIDYSRQRTGRGRRAGRPAILVAR